MCRWLAYTGSPLLLEEFLFKAKHSLIDQSMLSKSAETPTNGDGFGVGWYSGRATPGLFRSIRPAWNDFNLRDLAAHIESPLFLAHIRATSIATVQETNCHPFRHGKWLFAHNGEILEVEKLRRDLMLAVVPELFTEILGTTDSELMFYLALTFGLEKDPLGAVERMAGFVEDTARKHGVNDSLWMTLGFSDGKTVYGVRYATDQDAPTLYHSRHMEDLHAINPDLKGKFAAHSRAIVSEPIGKLASAWVEIPQATAVTIVGGAIHKQSFVPRHAPAAP